jgi:hypothetical protein
MKKLLVAAGLAGVAFGGWKLTHRHHDGNKLLADRIWIDHIPRNDRDFVNLFVLIDEHDVGVFGRFSQWQGAQEQFKYEIKGGKLEALFPQTGDKESINVKARTCDANGFDFCLELDGGSHGAKKYYSMEGWEIDSTDHDKIEQRLKQIK